jgi:hypothetical protein
LSFFFLQLLQLYYFSCFINPDDELCEADKEAKRTLKMAQRGTDSWDSIITTPAYV